MLNNLTFSVRILQRNTSSYEITNFVLLTIKRKKRGVDYVTIVIEVHDINQGEVGFFNKKIASCLNKKRCSVLFNIPFSSYMSLVHFEEKRFKRCSFGFDMFLCITISALIAIEHPTIGVHEGISGF